jgi:hypothetical protein
MIVLKLRGGDMNLYSAGKNKPKVATGFATREKALQTLSNIKQFPLTYQKQVVITMYNRAKYHPNRTKTMHDAMKVYNSWMNRHHIIISKTKKYKPKHKQEIQTKKKISYSRMNTFS